MTPLITDLGNSGCKNRKYFFKDADDALDACDRKIIQRLDKKECNFVSLNRRVCQKIKKRMIILKGLNIKLMLSPSIYIQGQAACSQLP